MPFVATNEINMHRRRRAAVWPIAKPLMGTDSRTAGLVLATAGAQVAVACWAASQPWWLMVLAAYWINGTLAHSLFLGIHELSHHLVFKTPWLNDAVAMVANGALVVPFAMPFRRYHLMHHAHINEYGRDPDMVTQTEARLLRSRLGKLVFSQFQVFFYAIRPLVTMPRLPNFADAVNVLVVFAINAAIVWLAGWETLGVLALGLWLGTGIHPMGFRFYSEHHILNRSRPADTYSSHRDAPWWYKALTYNVGYHVEHHDCVGVPWTNLDALYLANQSEYDALPQPPKWRGWIHAFWTFIMEETIHIDDRYNHQ